MDIAVCSKIGLCLENGRDGLVLSKGNGEVTVGADPALSAWLGGVQHGGVYSNNVYSNKPLSCMLQQLSGLLFTVCLIRLLSGAFLQHKADSLSTVCIISQCYLTNPCFYQWVKRHQNTFFTLQYLSV